MLEEVRSPYALAWGSSHQQKQLYPLIYHAVAKDSKSDIVKLGGVLGIKESAKINIEYNQKGTTYFNGKQTNVIRNILQITKGDLIQYKYFRQFPKGWIKELDNFCISEEQKKLDNNRFIDLSLVSNPLVESTRFNNPPLGGFPIGRFYW